jgi:hypothetical protein
MGSDEGTLIGHGLAAQVREAAERIAKEQAAAAAADDEATRIEQPAMQDEELTRIEQPAALAGPAVPPPPAGRARLPGVSAPGSVDAAPLARNKPSSVRVNAPPPMAKDADAVVTAPEIASEDVSRLQRASQATVAISPNQMRDLSEQLHRPKKQRSMLLWFAVPAAVFGVIAIIIAIYLLVAGQ